LEWTVDEFCCSINRNLAEQNGACLGINYIRDHPNDEFVIFVIEQGNFLQRTNPFYPPQFSANHDMTTTTTRSTTTTTVSNTLGIMRYNPLTGPGI